MARRSDGKFQVSHSEMETFKQCKRKWFLQYYMRLVKRYQPPRVAADTGTTVHSALHVYYQLGGVRNHEPAYEAALAHLESVKDAALARDLEPEDKKKIEEIHELTAIATEGYFSWLIETGADDHWTVQGSEEKLEVDGPHDSRIKGYVDLWGTHDPSGDLLVVDTKVIASISDTLKTLHLNEQGPLYAVLMKMLRPDEERRGFRVVWNMIKRNKQSARAKPPFYQRYELAINSDMLNQFYEQLHGQIGDMIELERRLNNGEPHHIVAYPTPTRDCSWKCPYLSICGAMNDPRTDTEWILNNNFEQWGSEPKMDATVEIDE